MSSLIDYIFYPTKELLTYFSNELYSTNSDLLTKNATDVSLITNPDYIRFEVSLINSPNTESLVQLIKTSSDSSLVCTLTNTDLDTIKSNKKTLFNNLNYGFTDFDDTLNWGTDSGVASIVWEQEKDNPVIKVNSISNRPFFVFERWVGDQCNFKALSDGTNTAPNIESMLQESNIIYKNGWQIGLAYLDIDQINYKSTSDYIHIDNATALITSTTPTLLTTDTSFLSTPGTQIELNTDETIVSYVKNTFSASFPGSIPSFSSFNALYLWQSTNSLIGYIGIGSTNQLINLDNSTDNLKNLEIEIEDKWQKITII